MYLELLLKYLPTKTKKRTRMKSYDFWHSGKINIKSRLSLPSNNKRGGIYIYYIYLHILTVYVLWKASDTTIALEYVNNWITWFSSAVLLEETCDGKCGLLCYKMMQIPMFPDWRYFTQGLVAIMWASWLKYIDYCSGAEELAQVLIQQWGLKLEQIWGDGAMNCGTVFAAALTTPI